MVQYLESDDKQFSLSKHSSLFKEAGNSSHDCIEHGVIKGESFGPPACTSNIPEQI